MSDEDRFADSPISRRRFFQLSGAVGASLALPGNATASAEADAFTAEYQYVLNHTPEDHAVPTLVRFSDMSGPTAMEGLVGGQREVRTTTEPEPAAYAPLTTAEAETVADLPSASEFQFSPGSNPFWRIGYYPAGVFPEPRRSVDYIGFEQLKDGLAELEERYPDRINVRLAPGKSPGHYNNATDREDPKQMLVVELTNDVQDREAFAEKEKVFHSCSLHGPERAGAEAGARVIENVARSSEPDIQGSDAKLEPLLDDVVVLLGFTNPDGWVVRNPQYDSGWQFTGPGGLSVSPVGEAPRIPAAPLYERGNAEVYDTNRQYPVVGMITPNHFPAQPNDPKSEEEETPSFVNEKVPDAKAFVDFFSQYDNLNYGSDLHGGPIFNEFVLGLISQDQFNTREIHELYEMCLNIDDTLEAALEKWVTAGNIKKAVLGDFTTGLLFGVLPEQAFDYSTIYDTIDYTVSGAFLDWMAHPEPIGLDLTTLDFEMSFSWAVNGNVYNPELVEMEVKGYRTAIRTITAFAVRNSDTPGTEDQFDTRTETGGDDVAYVTTGEVGSDEDALRSTDDDLQFEAVEGAETTGGEDGVTKTERSVTLSEETTELSFEIEETDLHSAGFHIHSHKAVADIELVDPNGERVGQFEGVTEERGGGKCCGLPEVTMSDPEPGTWTVRVNNLRDVELPARFMTWTLAASGPNPDPRTAWPDGEGYQQREYEATPFRFFEDYAEYIPEEEGTTVEPVTVEEVASGALVENGEPAYDHVVVIHDYGANADADYFGEVAGYLEADHPTEGFDEPGYTEALDEFVDADGNLVLTDAGVNLLTELDNDLVNGDAMSRDDIALAELLVPRFEGENAKNLAHPLFGDNSAPDPDSRENDARPIQNQLWKVQPLGYYGGTFDSRGQAPMFLPNPDALAAAGASATTTVAGRSEDPDSAPSENFGLTEGTPTVRGIAAGSLTPDDSTDTGVHFISSLLAPPTQANLHPFGLQNYTVTFLGYVMFTSALGFVQVRETGETVRRYGRTNEWDTSGVEHLEPPSTGPDLSVTGSRTTDSQVQFGGRTEKVDLTVESVDTEADSVEIRDRFPDNWEFLEDFSDGTSPDGESYVTFEGETTDPAELEGTTFTYFIETPSGVQSSGSYTVGPGVGIALDTEEDVSDEFAGTKTIYVAGADAV